ncbi:MAG: hypothetical protein C1943_08470 [Halochromatium sp.]|nr:hypothetical protein [Halochromatium sp.]
MQLEQLTAGDTANPDCQVHLYDRDTEVYHRQPCPAALASASGVFEVEIASGDRASLQTTLAGQAARAETTADLLQ